MIVAQDLHGLVLWPLHEVAMIRAEYQGRLEVLHVSGRLAHATGPAMARPPLVQVNAATAVHPGLARQDGEQIALPGGWRIPGTLPAHDPPSREEERPLGPGGPVPSEVLYFQWRYGRGTWVTPAGTSPWQGTREEAEAAHGGLLRLDSRSVNLAGVRAIQRGTELVFRDGTGFGLRPEPVRILTEHLGLPNLRQAGPQTATQESLFRLALRDWPTELLHAKDAWLREEFRGDLPRLLANLIWQIYRLRAGGADDDYARDHRGLFYNPVILVVARAGLLSGWAEALGLEPTGLSPKDRIWVAMLRMLDRLVMDERLFTFTELGFDSARPDLRHVGDRNPAVVLLAEKGTLRRAVEAVGRRFGISWLILGGQPSSFGTELFADLIRAALDGRPILVLALVDFDPAGWTIAEAFCRQAERFGLRVQELRFLVRPERFTPEELQRIALPLEDPEETLNRRWREKSGGVNGEARTIYADSLRPISRVEQAVSEESGLA